jgi:steroid delta-isomerase-like uncharacterized protein
MYGIVRRVGCAMTVVAACFLFAGVSATHASDIDHNKALFTKFVDEVMNKGNMAVVDELLAEDFVEHEEMPPGLPAGREGCKAFFTMYRKAFPDTKVTIDDLIAEGDKVVARMTWHGTNKGEFMGTPATGKTVDYSCIDIVRIVDGKAVEHWGVADRLGMMEQMHPMTMGKPMKVKSKK